MLAFERRPLGRTKLQVTTMGLGTATMGGSRFVVTQETRNGIVSAAWDAGVRYVDTAPFYGVGASERSVGDALRDKDRDQWVLSTKVGRLLRPKIETSPSIDGRLSPLPFKVLYDYTYDGIMRSIEDSYQRLGLARIDVLYVHDIGVYQHGEHLNKLYFGQLKDSGYKALDELRRAGVVSAIGLGVNETAVLIDALKIGDWDAFLLAGRYTLLEQAPLEDLLPECQRRGTSLVIGGPLNSGILAGRDTWNYEKAPKEIVDRVRRLELVCNSHKIPLAAAALQFPLAHPTVACVIPGPRSPEEFKGNLPLFGMKIPASLWSDLRSEGLLHPAAPVPV